jgi:hypothetical protein
MMATQQHKKKKQKLNSLQQKTNIEENEAKKKQFFI